MALNNLTRIGNSGFGTDTSINTTGIVTAASFSGDGSGLTGVTALGSGVVVQEEGSNVGTAQTINFIGTGVTATLSGGIASVEIATSGGGGGGFSNVVEDTTPQLGGNLDLNSNNITGTGDISITGDATFSGDLDVDGHVNLDNVSIAGVSTFAGITTVTGNTLFAKQLSTTGISTFRSDVHVVNGSIKLKTPTDNDVFNISYSAQNDDVTFGFDQTGGTGGSQVQFSLKDNAAFRIKNSTTAGTIAKFTADGNNELYYDDSKKFETTSTGAIVTGTLVATATTATNVTVANETSDTECFVMFGVNATGDNAPKSSSSLKYNSSTGGLTAGSFIGDGSGLTGITASGSGVIVRDDGSLVGTAGTIDFGTNVSVSPISAGVVTVTASAGSIPGINTSGTTEVNNLIATGVITATSFNGNGASVTNVNAVSIGGTPLTDLQKKNADTDLVMFNQILHFGPANTKSRIRWSGTTSLWDLIDGDLKIRDNTTDRFTFERTTGNFSASNVNVSGIITASSFSGDGSSLTNLPASGISTAFTNVQVTYDVSSNGSSAYRITGPGYSGADDNPDIYLVRGQRYRFINGTGSSHPFRIQSDTSGTAYTDGVSGSQNGTQDFNVQHDAPARLYYQCTIHSGMIGNIYIVGGSDWRMTDVATNATPEIYTDRNVGIGTDNPNAELQLNADGFANLTIASSRTTATDQIGGVGFSTYFNGTQDQVAAMTARVNGNIVFKNTTSNLERLNIRSDGDVVIGTSDLESQLGSRRRLAVCDTTNGALLHLRGQSPAIFFDQSGGNIGKIYLDSVDLAIYSNTPNSEGSERLRINSAGNVGIGTTFPQEKLHIHEGDVVIGQDAGNNTDIRNYIKFGRVSEPKAAIGFVNNAGNGRGDIIFMNNNDATNASFSDSDVVFRIDSNGYRSFSTQPYVLLRKDGTTANITADAIVEFDSTVTSEGGMTVNASRSRITVPKAGKYAVLGAVAGTNTNVSVGDGWRLDLYRDGAVYANSYLYPINSPGASTGEEYTLQTSLIVPADANDYFEFKVASVGSARASVRYGYFCVYYLG